MVTLVIFYGSITFCFFFTILRITRALTAPVNLAWDIQRKDPVYDLVRSETGKHIGYHKWANTMTDLVFLKGFLRYRPWFWLPLFLFHAGIYLLFTWHVLLVVESLADFQVSAGTGRVLGHLGAALAFSGGTGILAGRVFSRTMRKSYPPIHYLKWVFILAMIVQGYLAVVMHFGDDYGSVAAYVTRQFQFDWQYKLHAPLAPSLHVLLVSAWLIFFPFSHVPRLFFRYYRELRWDHVRNRQGGHLEKILSRNLGRPVTWAAPHVGGANTWSSLVKNVSRKGY